MGCEVVLYDLERAPDEYRIVCYQTIYEDGMNVLQRVHYHRGPSLWEWHDESTIDERVDPAELDIPADVREKLAATISAMTADDEARTAIRRALRPTYATTADIMARMQADGEWHDRKLVLRLLNEAAWLETVELSGRRSHWRWLEPL